MLVLFEKKENVVFNRFKNYASFEFQSINIGDWFNFFNFNLFLIFLFHWDFFLKLEFEKKKKCLMMNDWKWLLFWIQICFQFQTSVFALSDIYFATSKILEQKRKKDAKKRRILQIFGWFFGRINLNWRIDSIVWWLIGIHLFFRKEIFVHFFFFFFRH